jgi:hypothetical protein
MPLLRRNSSKKEANSDNTDEHDEGRPSLLKRLSRRSSREHVNQVGSSTTTQEHDHGATSTNPASHHEVLPASPKPSQPAPVPTGIIPGEVPIDDVAPRDGLSKEDVRALFFGAPHFMLEKGRHGKSFPQAFFPWNTDLEVSDLQDRRYLTHESYALITLHAHLPIPDEMNWKPSSLPQRREGAWKRPMLDVGIFETPNMLSVAGREPGTVGLRFFLEVPISERLRTIEKAKEDEKGYGGRLAHMSANEAFKLEANRPRTGKHAPRQDRVQLIEGGPKAWERLGIRDISASALISRMAFLCELHDEVLEHGLGDTILHRQNCTVLYDELFTNLLYLPTKLKDDGGDKDHRAGLKVQIEALVNVLTTPGAWIDFSLVEPRIRLGQALWEVPPYDGQSPETLHLGIGAERKWLLLQILLSMELMVRLDAALRLGSSDNLRDFHLTGHEISHFNKERNLKVDWDLVVARRFLDLLIVKQGPAVDLKHFVGEDRAHQPHLSSMFKKKMDLHTSGEDLSIWSCEILPRRADVQFQGLLRFARMIEWPCVDDLEVEFTRRYQDPSVSHEKLYAQPISGAGIGNDEAMPSVGTMRSFFSGDNWVESPCINLKPVHGIELGSFLSRSWLMGLVMPGDAGCLSIMACLLEQDKRAAKLPRTAYLHAGFVLDGRSFWSKFCIVGRVLAPLKGSRECVSVLLTFHICLLFAIPPTALADCISQMGWLSTPHVLPVDNTGKAFTDTWVNVTAAIPPDTRNGLRIYDGQKLGDDSNVLGTGRGKISSSEYIMVTDKVLEDLTYATCECSALILHKKSQSDSRQSPLSATLTFKISSTGNRPNTQELRLTYGTAFVSGHPCRPPHGHTTLASNKEHEHPHHTAHERLPSHPLHKTYRFERKSIADLINASPPKAGRDQAVWLVDARGPASNDTFVRAWCSQVGKGAIISRVGKSCLSCSIREAFALELCIIIRVGDFVSR